MTTEQVIESAPPRYTVWTVVRDAIRGVAHDYTSGSVGRAIVLLAIPMVLEMAMESVFAVVDVFWVSRLGPDAIATVGLTESMLTLVYTAAMGLSIGVAAVVARRIGEKRPDEAAQAAVQGIALGLVVAAVVAVLGITLAPKLLALMGASPAVIAIGIRLYPDDAGRQCHGAAAVPDQCDLPGCRRCRDRHASALARQHHQHPARPLSDLRPGAFPPARGHRRRSCHHHRPRHRRPLSAVSPQPGRRRASLSAGSTSPSSPLSWRTWSASPGRGRFRFSWAPRATSAWFASSRPSAARRSRVTPSPSGW